MSSRIVLAGFVSVVALAVAAPAFAGDASGTAGAVEWSLGTGVTMLHGEEIVYEDAGSDTVLSHLFWDSTSPVLTANLNITLPEGWTIKSGVALATGGDGYMEDYDWIDPASYAFDDWSHRSQHPDTNLDWYFNGQLFFGKDVIDNDGVKVNLNAGVKYVNVQWTAYGGSYVYSSGPGSPRDEVGDFPDGEKGITLNQFFPAALAGIDTEFTHDAWDFGLSAHAGITFNAGDNDFHWMRTDIGPAGGLFNDILNPSPVVQLSATAKYAITDSLSFFITGSYEEVFTARGDTDMYALYPDGSQDYLTTFADAAGGNFKATTLSVGLTGTF